MQKKVELDNLLENREIALFAEVNTKQNPNYFTSSYNVEVLERI